MFFKIFNFFTDFPFFRFDTEKDAAIRLASTSPKTNNFILFLSEFHFDDFRENEAFQMF